MEKADQSQLELFSSPAGYSEGKERLPRSVLSYLWSYEKAILIVIGLLITGIIGFSVGFERGRHAASRAPAQATAAQKLETKVPPVAANQVTTPPIQRPQPAAEPVTTSISSGGYTIQVAAFQTKKLAQDEAEFLKKRGFSPVLLSLSKNGYTILCVGTYRNRAQATEALSELKKRYSDCFIRRL